MTLLAEQNTHHLHLAMMKLMKLLTLALLCGAGVAITSLRGGDSVAITSLRGGDSMGGNCAAARHTFLGHFTGSNKTNKQNAASFDALKQELSSKGGSIMHTLGVWQQCCQGTPPSACD